ncbi:DUF3450 domain-containing protein [Vibrio sp. TH_r3]|uniref:DUF3450 domain-containing protein n=1 Tax=Vibrio sp. TH_r3 TaxID=3082084 RepID=UPI002954066D|nr:DUF3450 domain-containing protein [Vibrio sp. TH_r3]MDV7103793.1 DUF3450 domain-containing protein [Vibrio sp. TH_r3]
MYKYKNKMRSYCIVASLCVLTTHHLANASSLAASEKIEQSIVKNAQKNQIVIDERAEHSAQLQFEIDALKAEIKGLETYQTHLNNLLDNQNQEMSSIDRQLTDITETRQSIVPLMYEMLAGLGQLIQQGMPIQFDVRQARLNSLSELMVQANVSDAEKFRRILEAYQIELDYVQKLDSYVSNIEIEGVMREVEQLYLGHVSFIARSLDKQKYWLWVDQKQQWIALEEPVFSQLDDAFLLANKRVSPSILTLPLSIQEVNDVQ